MSSAYAVSWVSTLELLAAGVTCETTDMVTL
jgi:hypothetical protein